MAGVKGNFHAIKVIKIVAEYDDDDNEKKIRIPLKLKEISRSFSMAMNS